MSFYQKVIKKNKNYKNVHCSFHFLFSLFFSFMEDERKKEFSYKEKINHKKKRIISWNSRNNREIHEVEEVKQKVKGDHDFRDAMFK